MSEYVFSGMVLSRVTKIHRRKWWQIFSHDQIIETSSWVRKGLFLNKAEADELLRLEKQGIGSPGYSLFLKAFAGGGAHNVQNIQLEEGALSTPYIPTTGFYAKEEIHEP